MMVEQKIAVTESMLRHARIPSKFWDAQVSVVADKKMQSTMYTYVDKMREFIQTGTGVLVCGTPSTGKTAFSCILLREALSFGAYTFFIRSSELVGGFKDTNMDTMKNCDILCIDDLGGEDVNARTLRVAEYILRYRFEDKKATIVSSNCSSEDLKRMYSDVFLSIVQRACPYYISLKSLQFKPQMKVLEVRK